MSLILFSVGHHQKKLIGRLGGGKDHDSRFQFVCFNALWQITQYRSVVVINTAEQQESGSTFYTTSGMLPVRVDLVCTGICLVYVLDIAPQYMTCEGVGRRRRRKVKVLTM